MVWEGRKCSIARHSMLMERRAIGINDSLHRIYAASHPQRAMWVRGYAEGFAMKLGDLIHEHETRPVSDPFEVIKAMADAKEILQGAPVLTITKVTDRCATCDRVTNPNGVCLTCEGRRP